MKLRRTHLFIIMLFTIFGLSACASQTKEKSLNLVFSEYYQNADDYEEIYPLLNKYFSCIQSAYEESDKANLNSFILSEEYAGISNQLSTISSDDSGMRVNGELNTSDEYIARLKLINPYLQIEVHLRGKDLLKTSASSNEEWFNELETLLVEIYSEYENGTGNN